MEDKDGGLSWQRKHSDRYIPAHKKRLQEKDLFLAIKSGFDMVERLFGVLGVEAVIVLVGRVLGGY